MARDYVSVYSTVLCSVRQKNDGNALQLTVDEGRLVSITFRPAFIFVGIHPEVLSVSLRFYRTEVQKFS
jgi:hypothetical protein